MLGHSGATIEIHEDHVLKTGHNLAAQAKYCSDHPDALVHVDAFWPTSPERYRMERLQPCHGRPVDVAAKAIALVRAHLWKPVPDRENYRGGFNLEWHLDLHHWAEENKFDWITRDLIHGVNADAPVEEALRAEFIHGDFTLANMMCRGAQLVLIDPIPATGKVPPLREVDYGKLMQSALGWEYLLTGAPPVRNESLIDLVYRESYKDGLPKQRVEFWTMVHLARTIPYARNGMIRDWAEAHSKRIAHALGF